MNRYRVKALSGDGRVSVKILDAESVHGCARVLAAEGKTLVSASLLDRRSSFTKSPALSSADMSEFSSIVSSLLASSLGIRDSLEMCRGIARKKTVRELSGRLLERIDKGNSFAGAIGQEGKTFPSIVLGLVKIGEQTGNLAASFARITLWAENRRKVRSSLAGALTYPALVLFVMLAGSLAVSIYAVPKLSILFSGIGGPASVELTNAMAHAKTSFFISMLFFFFFTAIIAFGVIHRSSGMDGKKRVDTFLIRIPVLGAFLVDSNTLDFVFAMEALVMAGVSIDNALDEAKSSVSNARFASAVAEVQVAIRKGIPLSKAFAAHGVFPGQLAQWLAVGERSGKVGQVFCQLRAYYQDAVARWTSRFIALVEPGITVFVGAFILFAVFTFVIPFFNAYGSLL